MFEKGCSHFIANSFRRLIDIFLLKVTNDATRDEIIRDNDVASKSDSDDTTCESFVWTKYCYK